MASEPRGRCRRDALGVRSFPADRRRRLAVEPGGRRQDHRRPQEVRWVTLKVRNPDFSDSPQFRPETAKSIQLLFVVLYDLGLANPGLTRIASELTQRSALTKKVPALVKRLF